MTFVMDRIQEHYNHAIKKYDINNVIGIFLTGSQNYGTDIESSDVDTQLIITPTLNEIYLGHRPESTTLKMPESNEQIKVKDIRQFIKEISKQNMNTLEILYTEYCIINPAYKKIWESLCSKREEISRLDPELAVKAIKGNALNTLDRIYLDNGDISFKQVANLVRYEYYLTKYIEGKPFVECMRPDEKTKKYILQIRNGTLGATSLRAIAETTGENIRNLVENFTYTEEISISIQDFLNEICKEFIDSSFLIEYAKREMI